jgi:predicted O-methyltransferase YrrM
VSFKVDKIKISDLFIKAGEEFNKGRWVSNDEGELLRRLVAASSAKHAFESGTANGFSTCWLACSLLLDGKVFTYDPVNRPKVWDQKFGVEALKDSIVCRTNVFKEVKNEEVLVNRGEGTYLFFIDGDHGQMSILQEWEAIQPLLKKGDVVVFHDLNIRNTLKAFHKIVQSAPTSRVLRFETARIMGVILYDTQTLPTGDESEETIVISMASELNSKTAKVRDIPKWKNDHKPWTAWPERALLTSGESHAFYDVARRLGSGSYANLGTFTGASAAYMAIGLRDSNSNGTIFAVDTWDLARLKGYPKTMMTRLKELGLDGYVTPCKGYTSEWAKRLSHLTFRFVLVDASHTYLNTLEDFNLWGPLVEVGGEIGFHDCEHTNVQKVIEENVLPAGIWEQTDHIYRLKMFRKVKSEVRD